jgi:uncharacterized protein YpbB
MLAEHFKDKEYFQQEDREYGEPTGSLQKQLGEKFAEVQQRSIEQGSEIDRLKMQLEKQAVLISDLQNQFDLFKKQEPAEEIIEIRNISMEQIKEEMISLLSDKKTRYADEIAAELKLDIKDVIEGFRQLQEEGKLFVDEASL